MQFAGLADDLADKKRQLLALEAKLESLKELKPIVERASVDMETIGDHLAILSEVWKAVSRRKYRPAR